MYRYGLMERPVMPGALPKGYNVIAGEGTYEGVRVWNVVEYPEKLSQEDVDHYNLYSYDIFLQNRYALALYKGRWISMNMPLERCLSMRPKENGFTKIKITTIAERREMSFEEAEELLRTES